MRNLNLKKNNQYILFKESKKIKKMERNMINKHLLILAILGVSVNRLKPLCNYDTIGTLYDIHIEEEKLI